MLYTFQCRSCEHHREEIFLASDYEKRVSKDGKLKRAKCEKCKKCDVYRFIGKAPAVLGGPGGYVSMERYWAQNPDIAKKQEAGLREARERTRKFKNDAIKRQKEGEQIGPKRKDQ